MNIPPDTVIAGYFATIRKAAGQRDPGSKIVPALDDAETRTLRLAERARGPAPDVDGYPRSTGGGGGATSGGAISNPVLGAVLELADDEYTPPHDVTVRLAEDAIGFAQQMAHSWGALTGVLDRADRVVNLQSKATGGQCAACDKVVTGTADDRLRSGMCDACRKDWVRKGRPDRIGFRAQRLARNAERVPTDATG